MYIKNNLHGLAAPANVDQFGNEFGINIDIPPTYGAPTTLPTNINLAPDGTIESYKVGGFNIPATIFGMPSKTVLIGAAVLLVLYFLSQKGK